METILYGNNISLTWSFTDAVTGEAFSFEDIATKLFVKSYYLNKEITHTITNNTIVAVINSNDLPHESYSLELQYYKDTVELGSKVIINDAFQITGDQAPSGTVDLEIESMALPLTSTDITAIEYLEFDKYLQLKNKESLSKRSLYIMMNENGDADIYLYKYKYPQAISEHLLSGTSSSIVADEEDLTLIYKGGVSAFRFKDRTSENGLGYVILRKEQSVFEQMTHTNTIYEIRYDFDLNGETLSIPAGCVLHFNGGSLYNGYLLGTNTSINSGYTHIFKENLTLTGSFNICEWIPEWFGAKGNDNTFISTTGIQKALDAAKNTTVKTVKLIANNYYIDDTLVMYSNQSLIGASPSVRHYSGINIRQKANKHAIQLTSNDLNIWRICLKDFTITNEYYGSDMNNCGIYVYNGDVLTYFYNNEIENVCCTQFDKGFMYDGYGDGAFAYNYFHEFAVYYNKIGLYIKGNKDITTEKYPWCNLNRWSFCKFMSNSIGGIYFHGTRSQQENVFESCAIEQNGLNYKLADYEKYGCAGWAFRGNNSICFGYTRFYNCYVENNFPRRELGNNASYNEEKEYLRGTKYIYPIDIETNELNAAFACYRQNITVEKCLLSRYIKLYSGKKEFSLRFEGNDYDFGKLTYAESPTIDYLFYFNLDQAVVNYCNIHIDESYPKGDRDSDNPTLLTRIKSVFKLGDACYNQANRNIKMYINVPSLEKPIHYNGRDENNVAKIYNGCIYVDGINGSNNSFITSRLQALKGLAYAEQLSKYYKGVDEVTIRLINDYTSNDDNYDGAVTNNIRLIGDKDIEYTIKKTKQLPTKTKIENIIFNAQHPSWSHMFETDAETIEFVNCTFNLQNVEQYIAKVKRGGHMFFSNCKFNVADTSKGTTICVQNNNQYTSSIHDINCTVQEGCVLQAKPYIWLHSNYTNKREIIVTDIDLLGETIDLPSDAVIEFKGGKFKNGTITLNKSLLLPMGMPLSYYVDTTTCTISGENWATGQTLYDTESNKMKLWNGNAWTNLDGTTL